MKLLSELIKDFDNEVIQGDTDIEISDFVTDNRKITKGSVFVCIKGANFDGHSVVAEAVAMGAKAVVTESEIDLALCIGITVIKCESTREAMAYMACAWNDYPSRELTMIGITGTKGKTTTTYLIKSILENAGKKVGLIGTIEMIIGDEHIPAKNTTPESTVLQETLRKMADAGCDTVVMEVSSQALMLHRTLGIDFNIGIFTNIEPDHIGPNEHTSFEHYIECKSRLFRQCRLGILNSDDKHMDTILNNHTCEVVTYGIGEKADYYASDISYYSEKGVLGARFTALYNENGKEKTLDADINMPGVFSVYNALCAIAVCKSLGIDDESIKKCLLMAKVKGRIEMVPISGDFTLMIDYAHNAMALESLLSTLKAYNPARLVCVFGCGGNRARDRRFEMGEVSGNMADLTVITSDNPRFEDPIEIMNDIKTGISKTRGRYIEIPDRREAIRYVIGTAQKGDVIVLAGKGHEDYQEIKGQKYPMDERVIIKEIVEGSI